MYTKRGPTFLIANFSLSHRQRKNNAPVKFSHSVLPRYLSFPTDCIGVSKRHGGCACSGREPFAC